MRKGPENSGPLGGHLDIQELDLKSRGALSPLGVPQVYFYPDIFVNPKPPFLIA